MSSVFITLNTYIYTYIVYIYIYIYEYNILHTYNIIKWDIYMYIHVFAYTYTHTYATPKSYHIYIIGYWYCLIAIYGKVKTSETVLSSCLQLCKYSLAVKRAYTYLVLVFNMNTYSNRRVANHLHGLIFELKERMNSRQDRPVMYCTN